VQVLEVSILVPVLEARHLRQVAAVMARVVLVAAGTLEIRSVTLESLAKVAKV